jgi:hypothetical protein
MSKSLNISVIVAARDEYIEQLKCIICPLIHQGFMSIYNDAFVITEGNNTIYKFQELLKAIPTWNQTILQKESKRIKSKCPYIMNIVTAIFVSNVKILASIRLSGDNDNIKVKIPTSDIFIHSIYIESAYNIFYDPFIFYHKTKNNGDINRNKEIINSIIRNAVNETIRQLLPFDNILQEYLKSALENSESESESDSDSDSDSDNIDINKIVKNNEYSESDSDSNYDNDNKDSSSESPESPEYNLDSFNDNNNNNYDNTVTKLGYSDNNNNIPSNQNNNNNIPMNNNNQNNIPINNNNQNNIPMNNNNQNIPFTQPPPMNNNIQNNPLNQNNIPFTQPPMNNQNIPLNQSNQSNESNQNKYSFF